MGELDYEYEEVYDEIDNLLFELAVKLKMFDKVRKIRTCDVEKHVDENEIAERVDVVTAMSTLYFGLKYLELNDDPFSKYIVLKCFIALLRLKALINDCREVFEFCEELLKVIRSGLIKLEEEEFKRLTRRSWKWKGLIV